MDYVFTSGESKPLSCVGISLFLCFGTITSPIPISIPNGVLVFFMRATTEAPIPAYFFVIAMGKTSLS